MAVCGIFSFEDYPVISKIAYNLLNKIINKSDSFYKESFALKFYELIIELAKISDNLPKLNIESKNSINSILPAVNAINDGILEGTIPTINDLAVLCSMSESNFRKTFQKLIGFSPKDYITKNQICNAERLLITTDKSILEISLCSGFGEISVFNRNFKSQTGISPKEFRNKYSKKS
jgi:AraC-like DNA-binding protein